MGERRRRIWSAALSLALVSLAAAAPPGRVALGQFGEWGAFRDDAPARCYAVTRPVSDRAGQAALAIATWPRLRAHGQLHVRLSRVATGDVTLEAGGLRFLLRTRGEEAWAASPRDDARIVAALRGNGLLQLRATDERGHRFRDRYALDGAPSAIDAMRLGCLPG